MEFEYDGDESIFPVNFSEGLEMKYGKLGSDTPPLTGIQTTSEIRVFMHDPMGAFERDPQGALIDSALLLANPTLAREYMSGLSMQEDPCSVDTEWYTNMLEIIKGYSLRAIPVEDMKRILYSRLAIEAILGVLSEGVEERRKELALKRS